MSTKPKKLCIVPGCTNKRIWRGVCRACYFAAKRSIAAKEVTDEELVRRRLWLKPNRSGRPRKNSLAKLTAKS